MSKDEIKEIKGVWTVEEVKKIKSWASSDKGANAIRASIDNSQSQSEIIEKMAIVDSKSLKEPFTYIIK